MKKSGTKIPLSRRSASSENIRSNNNCKIINGNIRQLLPNKLNKSSSCTAFTLTSVKQDIRKPFPKCAWRETGDSVRPIQPPQRIQQLKIRKKPNLLFENNRYLMDLENDTNFYQNKEIIDKRNGNSSIKSPKFNASLKNSNAKSNILLLDDKSNLGVNALSKKNIFGHDSSDTEHALIEQNSKEDPNRTGISVSETQDKVAHDYILQDSLIPNTELDLPNSYREPLDDYTIYENNASHVTKDQKEIYVLEENVNNMNNHKSNIDSKVSNEIYPGESVKQSYKEVIKTPSITIKVPSYDETTGIESPLKNFEHGIKSNGYKPIGPKGFVPFTSMFSKSSGISRISSQNRTPNIKKIIISAGSITAKDKSTIINTRTLLKQELGKKKNTCRNNKIPLKINLNNQSLHLNNESDDQIIQSIEKRSISGKSNKIETRSKTLDKNLLIADRFENSFKILSPPRFMSSSAALKRNSENEISTQVSRASPVSSDIELLPTDILDVASNGQLPHNCDDEVYVPNNMNEYNYCEFEASPTDVDFSHLSNDFDDILSIASEDSSTNSLPKGSFGNNTVKRKNSVTQPCPILLTRSRSNSIRKTDINEVETKWPKEKCINVDMRKETKKNLRKKGSSPKIFLPDQKCFAKVQEALILQSKLLKSNINVSNTTLMRGLLSPSEFRELQQCPVLSMYAGC